MELGHFQLQMLVSLVAIVGAAFAALICDYLEGNNEQLRQLTVELKARREEDRKRSRLMTRHAPKVEKMAAGKERVGLNAERKRAVNSEALAAMERGAALAGACALPRSAPVAPVRRPKPEPQPELPKPEATPETILIVKQGNAKAAPRIAIKRDWGSLLARMAQAAKTEEKPTEILEIATARQPLPTGFQDGFVLNKLVEGRQPVTGLVVSIGVKASRKSDAALPESVRQLVQSLIGANDFAAPSGEDEFLLIYPQEKGASAQGRLSHIAQQLWDFQLRSLGWFEILFSWGGVEVRGELIEDAMASASERMQEARRGREPFPMAASAPAAV